MWRGESGAGKGKNGGREAAEGVDLAGVVCMRAYPLFLQFLHTLFSDREYQLPSRKLIGSKGLQICPPFTPTGYSTSAGKDGIGLKDNVWMKAIRSNKLQTMCSLCGLVGLAERKLRI